MTLTPKQRAKLKSLANHINNPYLIGKGELDQNIIEMLDKALEVHELIKVKLLKTSSEDVDAVASSIEKKLGAGIAQKIGRVIVVYRPSKKNPRIEL
ncbi:MAG: YhbY family RNA-binding protein [Bacilli bacterium]|nr:YhbY family RNA-binding protein [Bacilli bacterium]